MSTPHRQGRREPHEVPRQRHVDLRTPEQIAEDNTPSRSELVLIQRALVNGWKIPQILRTKVLKLLRETIEASPNTRKGIAAAACVIKIEELIVKQQALEIKREMLGIEQEQLNRTVDDNELNVTIQFVD